MGDLSSSAVQTQNRKARQFARSPVLFASIQLGKNLRGFILNASEGGVCVQTAREIPGDEPLDLRFQSVRPGAWVQARGRVVWKNETNTVAGLEFVDNNNEIAKEVRHWLSFGESLQELRGNWWPDPAAMDFTVPDAPSAEPPAATAPVTLPPVVHELAHEFTPLPPPAQEFAQESAPEPSLPPLPLSIDHAIGRNSASARRDAFLFVPEPVEDPETVKPDVVKAERVAPPAPERVPKTTRFTYEYVRPPSEEQRKGKLAMWAAGGACVFLLLIWFGLSHRNGPASQKLTAQESAAQESTAQTNEAPSTESANAIPAQPSVPSSPATKPATPIAPAPHASSAKPVAPVPRENSLASRPAASSKAEVVQTSAAKSNPAASPTAPATAGTASLVIQVGAMAEEANATKLATTLSTQHFPAFVSKHTTDRFYRVLVGPFPNNASLRETETDLQKNGYQTIEKRWTP